MRFEGKLKIRRIRLCLMSDNPVCACVQEQVAAENSSPSEKSRKATIPGNQSKAKDSIRGRTTILNNNLTDSPCKIHRIHHDEKDDNQQQTDFLSPAENRFARRNIPVEPAFIQIRVRKHNVALAVEYVPLPLVQTHGKII